MHGCIGSKMVKSMMIDSAICIFFSVCLIFVGSCLLMGPLFTLHGLLGRGSDRDCEVWTLFEENLGLNKGVLCTKVCAFCTGKR